MNYSKRVCKGLCQQADSLGLCMGICATTPDHAQQCYDNFKVYCQRQGVPYEPIPDFEKQAPQPSPKEESRTSGPGARRG